MIEFQLLGVLLLFFPPLTGELFAQAPVNEYPDIAVETVSDSSRYFVIRIQDDNGERLNTSSIKRVTIRMFKFNVFC